MAEKMICPNGCNANFITTAHAVQEWEVDSEGNFMEVTHDCIEVAHRPNPENIWTCIKCGAEGVWKDVPDVPPSNPDEATINQEPPKDKKDIFYQAKFFFTLFPDSDILEVSKALSTAIAGEVNEEFPEIDFVSSCEVVEEPNGEDAEK